MPRRTKIVATVGPASESEALIGELMLAGVDVFRLNFSHGSAAHHVEVASRIRRQAAARQRHIGILADLQGPKLRIGAFAEGAVELAQGACFRLDLELADEAGSQAAVGLQYRDLPGQVERGDTLLLDDGRIKLRVDDSDASGVDTRVLLGGRLGSHKGINRLGGGLAAPALTAKDMLDIESLAKVEPDFVAVSFVARAAELEQARRLLDQQGMAPALIAKIERAEVVGDDETLAGVVSASHGIMVARGDLGVEVGDAALIGIQKALISRARKMDRVVITATQMMESMINAPMPTRAEVFDVANAVLDGADAVMLSAETAIGNFPVEVVKAMADTCLGAERHPSTRTSKYRADQQFGGAQESIAMSAIYAANHFADVRGIACLTESGATPLMMSRLSSGRPIFALSDNMRSLRRMALCRGVVPLHFDSSECGDESVDGAAVEFLTRAGHLQSGDAIILTKGAVMGRPGGTSIMKILSVP